jgi:hypothetical protein
MTGPDETLGSHGHPSQYAHDLNMNKFRPTLPGAGVREAARVPPEAREPAPQELSLCDDGAHTLGTFRVRL